VLSGVFRKEADAQEVKRVGADDFMSKSFKPEQLLARVRSLLGG
jgi:DNA-binding response OmpR family regulator